MERVFIVGGSGSGKTTMARRLARTIGVEPVELDLRAAADRDELAAGERWVVEGIFLYEIEPLLVRADTIVWLDLPRRTTIRRIIVRHFWLSAIGRNRHRGLRLLSRFVRAQPAYYTAPAREPIAADDWAALSRALTVQRLSPHMPKVVHIRTPRAARRFSVVARTASGRSATG